MSSRSNAQRDWTLSVNSTNNYTQKNGNVNSDSERSSRVLSEIGTVDDVSGNGEIVSFKENWKKRGYDTYMIVARGEVDGKDSVVGVIVKSYPNQHVSKKFYLHDVIEIGAETDAATEIGVKTNVNNESTPININIPSTEKSVKSIIDSMGSYGQAICGKITGGLDIGTDSGVARFEADHGKNGRTDQSMANDNDLARVGFIIDNYDSIEIVTNNDGKVALDYEH